MPVGPLEDAPRKGVLLLFANTLPMNNNLLEIQEHTGDNYKPLVDFENWRVAILNYSPALLPENLTQMQRHNATDEVFVLLQGRCILFVSEGQETAGSIHAADLEQGKVYNVKKAVWHTHTLSRDAKVLVVENRDTTYDNSPFTPLTATQQQHLMRLTQSLWTDNTP